MNVILSALNFCLTLALFMARIRADDPQASASLQRAAMRADLFN
jgi:hypothetical protein